MFSRFETIEQILSRPIKDSKGKKIPDKYATRTGAKHFVKKQSPYQSTEFEEAAQQEKASIKEFRKQYEEVLDQLNKELADELARAEEDLLHKLEEVSKVCIEKFNNHPAAVRGNVKYPYPFFDSEDNGDFLHSLSIQYNDKWDLQEYLVQLSKEFNTLLKQANKEARAAKIAVQKSFQTMRKNAYENFLKQCKQANIDRAEAEKQARDTLKIKDKELKQEIKNRAAGIRKRLAERVEIDEEYEIEDKSALGRFQEGLKRFLEFAVDLTAAGGAGGGSYGRLIDNLTFGEGYADFGQHEVFKEKGEIGSISEKPKIKTGELSGQDAIFYRAIKEEISRNPFPPESTPTAKDIQNKAIDIFRGVSEKVFPSELYTSHQWIQLIFDELIDQSNGSSAQASKAVSFINSFLLRNIPATKSRNPENAKRTEELHALAIGAFARQLLRSTTIRSIDPKDWFSPEFDKKSVLIQLMNEAIRGGGFRKEDKTFIKGMAEYWFKTPKIYRVFIEAVNKVLTSRSSYNEDESK